MENNENSLRDLWYTIRQIDIRIIVVPGGEEKETRAESLFRNNETLLS